jgi:hypothetical protein
VATTTYNKPQQGKAFSWSYSKLKNYESCPKRHYEVDVAKTYKEDESDQLKWGNQLHDALAKRLGPHNIALPGTMIEFEDMCLKLEAVPGNRLVECKYAINADFAPVDWFAKDAWYRAIADVLIINGPVALAIDYKTGKVVEDSVQLALMAACIFAHFPMVQAVRTEFFWLKEDATSRDDFRRGDMVEMWRSLWPRIEMLKGAYASMNFPPKPGHLCKRWCPVVACPHHGK